MPYGLSNQTLNKLKTIFKDNQKIEEAVIFGSRAKGNYREGSDVDIAVKGKQLNYQDLKQIELKTDELLLPYELNLVLFHSINNTELTEHIERAGITIYKRKMNDDRWEDEN